MSEFEKVFEEYVNKFDDIFPMYQLGRDRSEEEIIAMMKKCIEEGKDAYDIGYLPDPMTTDAIY